jgi:hypothetical protein
MAVVVAAPRRPTLPVARVLDAAHHKEAPPSRSPACSTLRITQLCYEGESQEGSAS